MKKVLLDILLSVCAILAGVKPVLITIGVLIAVDTITGIWLSLKNGETLNSKKLSHTVSKAIIYQVFIISAFLVEKFIIPELPLLEISSGFIALTEILSIGENMDGILKMNIFDNIKKIFIRSQNIIPPEMVDDVLKNDQKNIK